MTDASDSSRRAVLAIGGATLSTGFATLGLAVTPAQPRIDPMTHFRVANIDGVSIFYREAGPPSAPVVLLRHGFPTSSRMYRNLIPLLADRYRVIAPDYPAFGHIDVPAQDRFDYTHAHLSAVISRLLDKLGIGRFAMYLMDFGGPIGYRLLLQEPQRVAAFGKQADGSE